MRRGSRRADAGSECVYITAEDVGNQRGVGRKGCGVGGDRWPKRVKRAMTSRGSSSDSRRLSGDQRGCDTCQLWSWTWNADSWRCALKERKEDVLFNK